MDPASSTTAGAASVRPLVLVADDDEDLLEALRAFLMKDGFDVAEASTGTQALEMIAAACDGEAPRPDAIVLDFCMPGYSGIGILRAARHFVDVAPTILLTGFPDRSLETFASRAGAVRVIRKPFEASDLSRALRAAILQRAISTLA